MNKNTRLPISLFNKRPVIFDEIRYEALSILFEGIVMAKERYENHGVSLLKSG